MATEQSKPSLIERLVENVLVGPHATRAVLRELAAALREMPEDLVKPLAMAMTGVITGPAAAEKVLQHVADWIEREAPK